MKIIERRLNTLAHLNDANLKPHPRLRFLHRLKRRLLTNSVSSAHHIIASTMSGKC